MNARSFFGKMAAATAILMCSMSFEAKAETQEVKVNDFTRLKVSSAIDVTIKQGAEYKVVVETAARNMKYVNVENHGKVLSLSQQGHANSDVKVLIIVPTLDAISASGASDIKIEDLRSNDLSLSTSGASDMSGKVTCNNLEISVSGASDCDLRIDCNDVSLTCSGASDVDLRGSCNRVSGSCSGASDVSLHGCAKDVNVRCSGASSVSR